jgi:heme exporter protein C
MNVFLKFYHRLGSPREFYKISGSLIPWFGTISLILILVGSYLGLVVAPADYQQGESYRIIYVHVPSAWLSMFIYAVLAVSAMIGLIWRMKMAFVVMICSAAPGAWFTLLALITGSLWGKPMWGTWWEWDARLTSELLLLFLYIGIIALYNSFDERHLAEKSAAILAIVGVINLPIIHYSVEWWNTLHQGSTVIRSNGPSMDVRMLWPLLIMAIGFNFYYGWALLLRARNQVIIQEFRNSWVGELLPNKGQRS